MRRVSLTSTPPMKRLLIAGVLSIAALSAVALPSVDAVQAEVQRGNYAQAESMMQEVVAAKPGSARAHYVYAEVLAHNRRLDDAERELQKAKSLDPKTGFTTPEKLQDFERALAAARQALAAPPVVKSQPSSINRTGVGAPPNVVPAPAGEGLPGWLWGVGGAAIAWLLWRVFGVRRNPPSSSGQTPMAMAPG